MSNMNVEVDDSFKNIYMRKCNLLYPIDIEYCCNCKDAINYKKNRKDKRKK